MEPLQDLELLVKSRYPVIAVSSHEEQRVEEVLQRVAARLDVPFFTWTLTSGLRRAGTPDPIYDTNAPAKALNNVGAMQSDGLYLFKDLHRHFEDPEVVRKIKDLAEPFSRGKRSLVVVAPVVSLPVELEKLAATFRLELPGEAELDAMVRRVVRELAKANTLRLDIKRPDYARLLEAMSGLTLFEAEKAVTRSILADLALDEKDVDAVVEAKKDLLQREGVIEYLPPGSGMGNVGGLANLKAWLGKRSRAFTPQAKEFGVPPPKGVVLLGVQGCGKTLAARTIAGEWSLPLLKMEPGRLYDKYVGESERTLDRALAVAERMAPCVLMIDEIEKGFAWSGSSESDAGLSRRIFGRMLGWLQERERPVFVVATCNAIESLPPELLRKGRFDEIFFVDLPNPDERRSIFEIHLTRRHRDASAFDLPRLAGASDGFSGAEIEQAIVAALYTAFSAGREITTDIVLAELSATKPLSVTRREAVDQLRAWAKGRAVTA